MAPGHRSPKSSGPASSGGDAEPKVTLRQVKISNPSSDAASFAESMLWAPALDASFRLPELSSSDDETFQPSVNPEFDDLGVHNHAYMHFHDKSFPAPEAVEYGSGEEPDMVIMGSTSRPQERRRRPPASPLRATLLPHAPEVTMPTIGNVGGFRRTRQMFQELTGSSPIAATVPREQLPPQRPLTVADFAGGVPFRYPVIEPPGPVANWKRTAAARRYSAAIYNQANMPAATGSARGYQYPPLPMMATSETSGITFNSAVGEGKPTSSGGAPLQRQTSYSAARPPRNKNTARQIPVRRTSAHKKDRRSYLNEADHLAKAQSDFVQRVGAQSAYLKMLVKKNLEDLAEASKASSKL